MQQEGKDSLIRAGQVITNLRSLRLFGSEAEQRIRQRISPATLDEIVSASRVSWLPIQLDVEMTDAVMAELGEKALFEWSWKSIYDSVNGPLLGPLLKTTLRVFGVKVASAFKILPTVWRRVYINCGEISFTQSGPHELRIFITDFPSEMANSKAYCVGISATFYAALVFMKLQGACVVESVSAAEKRADFKLTWQDRPTKE